MGPRGSHQVSTVAVIALIAGVLWVAILTVIVVVMLAAWRSEGLMALIQSERRWSLLALIGLRSGEVLTSGPDRVVAAQISATELR